MAQQQSSKAALDAGRNQVNEIAHLSGYEDTRNWESHVCVRRDSTSPSHAATPGLWPLGSTWNAWVPALAWDSISYAHVV
ncbi:hypothetical protein PG993_014859 [Apiospora rasikravindrae]|uniref:Uncharacterized protein n=1 Tax=Apiospora rasikravindrae TaxID=990691 RepID=A0ABR1RQE5_9PEZI